MSRISEINVGVARTINLGNYESMRLEASVTVVIEPGDDLAAVKAAIQPELRELLEQTWKAQHKDRRPGDA